MAWLSLTEDHEDHSQKTQDNNLLQTPQPSSESVSSGSSSASGGTEYGTIDDEAGSIGGAGAHE
ncbi:MAG: hypothetical protein QOJ02_2111 [Acidobacteriota bacterium]|jgi:hypothetical protein|nr:hypothetical protein [Acidobacteriota bacterium]